MCTVTVHRVRDDESAPALIVTMNRDERRDRAAERPPQKHASGLYPLDSEAGGTWFGVNQYGLCLSLLNRYDAIDYLAKQSRGLLIPELLACGSIAKVKAVLIKKDLSGFAPFTLMMNSLEVSEIVQWNGQELILQHPMHSEYMHLSSSSWQAEKVIPWRQAAFEDWVNGGAAYHENTLPLYNLCQPQGKAAYAPFVSREATFTKSITQYHCQGGQVRSHYWHNGALPDGEPISLTMPLHTA